MKTMVMKFGGSSVADDSKLRVVAQRIIENKEKGNNIIVVVSAQGKTTNNLISESESLSSTPNEREMDMLLSVGEQITASKLSILLNEMGHSAVSLTGWQAGIKTNDVYEHAKIETIYPERILDEIDLGKIVIITGFQGINDIGDITTLGRGGSDTTAVAIAAALGLDECYIYSDVDGIYSADPRAVGSVKKIDEISFSEMQEISDSGAKVLHNRSIQIGERFDCSIIAKSTFQDGEGSKVCKKIETNEIKSIVNNKNVVNIDVKIPNVVDKIEIFKYLLENNILVNNYKNVNGEGISKVQFCANKADVNRIQKLLEDRGYEAKIDEISKLSIVGYGVIQDNKTLENVLAILNNKADIFDINLTQSKIEIVAKNIDDDMVNELHRKLIETT